MADQADFSIETYLDRVDARLAELTDSGEKATYLQLCLSYTERKRERFEQTLDARHGDAFQIGTAIAGLVDRLEQVRTLIRASIAQAEATLDNPMIQQFVMAALARRHGFELPSAKIKERVH